MKIKIKKKLKSSSKQWIARHLRDEYVKKKEIQGYRSRSAFKLLEIDYKFKFLKKNIYILDLGSSPGGWSQVLSQKVKNGRLQRESQSLQNRGYRRGITTPNMVYVT